MLYYSYASGERFVVTESSRNGRLRSPQTLHCDCFPRTPDLESLTTSHIERAFLTVRQELKRFQRKRAGLQQRPRNAQAGGSAPSQRLHFVRQHHTLGTTPAVAAGLEEKPWSLEQVVEMTYG